MSKNSFIMMAIVIASSLVLSACTLGQKNNSEANMNDSGVSENDSSGIFVGNLNDLMESGLAQKCSWQDEQGVSGSVYIDGSRSYFETNGVMVSGTQESEIQPTGSIYGINDGEYVYTWLSSANEGIKTVAYHGATPEEEVMMEDNTDEGSEYDRLAKYEYQYQCQPWSVDEAMFVPPKDIVFNDYSQMMQESLKYSQEIMDSCNMFEGDEKTECLTNFTNIEE